MSPRTFTACLLGAALLLAGGPPRAGAKPPDLPIDAKVDCRDQPANGATGTLLLEAGYQPEVDRDNQAVPEDPPAEECCEGERGTGFTAIDTLCPCLCECVRSCWQAVAGCVAGWIRPEAQEEQTYFLDQEFINPSGLGAVEESEPEDAPEEPQSQACPQPYQRSQFTCPYLKEQEEAR